MKILFYVEPFPELNPSFRLGAFMDAVYMAENLKTEFDFIDVKIVRGDSLDTDGSQEYIHSQEISIPISIIRERDIKALFRTYQDAAHAWYTGSYTVEQSKAMGRLLIDSLGKWKPDIVIMHETQAPFIKDIWTNATVLHTMFGLTYRAPYPMMTLFDPQGLYGNSLLSDIVKNSDPISEEEKVKLGKIRQWYARQIIPHDPVWHIIERYQSRFDKLILLPLQVNNYYAFNECSPYQTQLELVEDVLSKTPSNWGVIVTEYGDLNSNINPHTSAKLSRRYSNFIHDSNFKLIPNISQAMIPHIDAVVTVSSSIGLQALLFGKPVISAGTSHVDAIACCKLENISKTFEIYSQDHLDSALHFIFSRYHHIRKTVVENPIAFYSLLVDMHEKKLKGKKGINLLPAPRDLNDVFMDLDSNSQWKIWRKQLEEKNIPIIQHSVLLKAVFCDAISFDLFDTLVNRPFVEPHELFQFIEPVVRKITNNLYFPFHHLRREAERKARESVGHRIEVTLDEIYEKLQEITGFSIEKIEMMKALEIEAETTMIYPRIGVKRVWNIAKCWKIPRTIITDIYLDEAIIKDVLVRNGLDDYDYLYVSATEKERKEDGTIYPTYIANIKRNHPTVKQMLHVGDNQRADGEMAFKFGLDTAIIPKAIDHFKKSLLAHQFNSAFSQMHANTSILIGTIANRFFSAPTTSYAMDTLFDGDTRNFGYVALGPFILGYVQWVIRRVQAEKAEKVYFLARDSFLIMKVYEEMRIRLNLNIPEGQYLYCSRRSVAVPTMDNDDAVYEFATLNFGTTTVRDFLFYRYGVEASELPKESFLTLGLKPDGSTRISYPRDMSLTIQLLGKLMPHIKKQAKAEKFTYSAYLKLIGADNKNTNIALVDIGYSGTMQRKISEMTGNSYIGLYMLTHNYSLHHFKDEKFEAWLEAYDDQRVAYNHDFNRYIPLIESLLSSEEGSLVRFVETSKDKLEKEFLYVSNEDDRINFIRALHNGTMTFIGDYLNAVGSFAMECELSPMVSSHLLFSFAAHPNIYDVKIFEEMILENRFAGAEFQVIANAKPFLDNNGKLSKGFYDRLYADSKWKEGAAVALGKYLFPTHEQKKFNEPEENTIDVIHQDTPLSIKQRKRKKLYNSPRHYFEDSKVPLIRPFSILFGNGFMGRINTRILRTFITNQEEK
jgi:FMN phosphatase YigB (HAD superfamily)